MGRVRSYISRHATAVFAVLAMACFFLQLMATEYQIGRSNNNQWLSDLTPELLIQLVVNHLGDALLLAMPFYLLSRRWRRLGWLVVLAVTIWCFAQFIYYPIYRDLMPFSSFFLFGNVTGVVVNFFNQLVALRQKRTLAALLDKLERLPELPPEELEQIAQKVRTYHSEL